MTVNPLEAAANSASPAFVRSGVASIAIRPQRIAYLVEAESTDQFLKAVEYASTEWGGMFHPIVPVRVDGSATAFAESICDLVKPDIIIDFGQNRSAGEVLRQRFSASYVPAEHLERREPGVHTLVAHPYDELVPLPGTFAPFPVGSSGP